MQHRTADRALEALDTFRRQAPPLLDGVREMPYPALQSAFDPMVAAATHTYITGQCYERIPDDAAATYVRFGEAMPTWMCQTHLYPLDGAATRVGATETAWAWRNARFAQIFIGGGQAEHRSDLRDWATSFAADLRPYGTGGVYPNFLMDEGPERARAAVRRQSRPTRANQSDLRPRQRLSPQPEHPARDRCSGGQTPSMTTRGMVATAALALP